MICWAQIGPWALGTRLKTLSGKITSAALEAAMVDAMNNKDLTACRQLHMISNIASISVCVRKLPDVVM